MTTPVGWDSACVSAHAGVWVWSTLSDHLPDNHFTYLRPKAVQWTVEMDSSLTIDESASTPGFRVCSGTLETGGLKKEKKPSVFQDSCQFFFFFLPLSGLLSCNQAKQWN